MGITKELEAEHAMERMAASTGTSGFGLMDRNPPPGWFPARPAPKIPANLSSADQTPPRIFALTPAAIRTVSFADAVKLVDGWCVVLDPLPRPRVRRCYGLPMSGYNIPCYDPASSTIYLPPEVKVGVVLHEFLHYCFGLIAAGKLAKPVQEDLIYEVLGL